MAKFLIIPLLFCAVVSFATVCKDTVYDTIKVKQTFIDTVHRVVDDSITIGALKETQMLYNTSFSNMQSSFNIFVIAVGIIVTALTLISIIFNIKITSDSKKEIKEMKDKFEESDKKNAEAERKFKEEIKTQSENQKTDFGNLKKEFMETNERILDLEKAAEEQMRNQKEKFETFYINNKKYVLRTTNELPDMNAMGAPRLTPEDDRKGGEK
jgi:hypothetical protein